MKNCKKIKFNQIGDSKRGYLIALEELKNIPFEIKRVYYIYDVPTEVKRGFHAHKKLEQILICLNGSLRVKCFDGNEEEIFLLSNANEGIYIGSMVWREMFDFEKDTILLILASEYYDEKDYIRDYNEFLNYKDSINSNRSIIGGTDLDTSKESMLKTEYEIDNNIFIHEKAIVDTNIVGDNTRIWGFSHVLKGASIGKNCNICEHVFIENDVKIGNNVTVKCGVYIWDGIYIEDNVFVGPCVTFINDRHPRSKKYPEKFEKTIICEGSSLGANSTIMGGIKIGKYATIGAGSVVLKDVNDYEIVVGNPAKVIGYNCKCGMRLTKDNNIYKCACGNIYKIADKSLVALT